MTDGTKEDFKVLHSWVSESVLPILKEGGAWVAPSPAPLSRVQVEEAFKIISEHPNYRGQTLMTMHRDGGTMLKMSGDQIVIEEMDL